MRERVEAARGHQRRRFEGTHLLANLGMGPAEVWRHCVLEEEAQGLAREMHLSLPGRTTGH